MEPAKNVSMAEWSKAVDLRPTIVRCEGSNPSRHKRIYIYLIYKIYI